MTSDSPHHVLTPGLMPVEADWNQGRVYLLDLTGERFEASSFGVALGLRFDEATPLAVDLGDWMQRTHGREGRAPDGWIFHVGRCGSTLLANLLGVASSVLVLKEVELLDSLFGRMGMFELGSPARVELESLIAAFVPTMFRQTVPSMTHFVVKPTCFNPSTIGMVDRSFSERCVFVSRPVDQVMRSWAHRPVEPKGEALIHPDNLTAGSPFREGIARNVPTLALEQPDRDIGRLTFLAHCWRSGEEEAARVSPDRMMRVEYSELSADPVGVALDVADWFGIPMLDAAEETMRVVANLDSHHVHTKRRIVDRSPTPPLSDDVAREVERVLSL